MARRLTVIDWFRMPPDPQERLIRIAGALESHARLMLEKPSPEDLRILSGEEGRSFLLEGGTDVNRPAWMKILTARFEKILAALSETGRGAGHPLLDPHGNAPFPRVDALLLDQDLISTRLAGSGATMLSGDLTHALLHRLLYEMAALLLWEAVADILGENPFLPLLAIYEEGLYPLDLTADVPVLWAPLA